MKHDDLRGITLGLCALLGGTLVARAGEELESHSMPDGVGHPAFLSPHAGPIAVRDGRVFVVNTPADTLDVIDATSGDVAARVAVGIDPVGVAVRPDGKEVWVSNHVSDSVSVVDVDAASETYLTVIATVQDLDRRTRATRFDEPVGIAFASNEKVYVALSSENQVAIVDVHSREVTGHLDIPAQDPRALVVRGERLYVIPFESGNQTQLSGGTPPLDGDLVTFDAWEHIVANNNVLSLGHVVDLILHPRVPDRDLFVFDTTTDQRVRTVSTLGTLLYGLAVDSGGQVFIAQADARNDANGRTGTEGHGLAEMENRAFLNQISRVPATDGSEATRIDLEPLPPEHPARGEALATPFAIEVSADDATLVATAAGSDRLFTVDAKSGEVLGCVETGAVPRGIALECDVAGAPAQAWVLNAVANTVSLVDLADHARPKVVDTVRLEDPTDPVLKRGRIAFESAEASTTGTFSCASCHPDGHTDQLLWVLDTPVVTGGDQIMPRSTMPVRGLRDTEPYHWDGIPGDPHGGSNSASVYAHVAPKSDVLDPVGSIRHLVDAGLASTMRHVDAESERGEFSERERDALARFLLEISYPPAPRRAYDDSLSKRAREGFELFHVWGDNDPKQVERNVCGDCHRMPFLVSTNTPGTGMDAPTWRGAYDRWLILPQGRLNIIDFDFYERVAERGAPEREIWQFSWAGRRRFDAVWDMVLEGSTGYSGAFARQVTLNADTANAAQTAGLLVALELAAAEGAVVLQGEGTFLGGDEPRRVALAFRGGDYVDGEERYTRGELVTFAQTGLFVGTFTARHGVRTGLKHQQPALWTAGQIQAQSGHQRFPVLHVDEDVMVLAGRHLKRGARLVVDGRQADGKLKWNGERVEVRLDELPEVGVHFLQTQNPGGHFSNELLFHVVRDRAAKEALEERLVTERAAPGTAFRSAVERGELGVLRRLVERGVDVNARVDPDGSTPLSLAAFRGHAGVVQVLLELGADVSSTNRDGGTALHTAAFLGELGIVDILLEAGASVDARNARGETPLVVVSGRWDEGLAGIYRFLGNASGRVFDPEELRKARARMTSRLKEER